MDHHSGLTMEEVKAALWTAMDLYKRAGCECCSPNPLEDVWEDLATEEADQVRTFGVELAYTGESIIQWAKEPESV